MTKVGTPTFVTDEWLAHAKRWPRRIIACLGVEDQIAKQLRGLIANGRRRHVFICNLYWPVPSPDFQPLESGETRAECEDPIRWQ